MMITNNPTALRILMNDDIYIIPEGITDELDADVVNDEIQKQENLSPSYFEYLGENNKYTLVIVDYERDTFIDDAGREFLKKILAAKSMDMQDIALLNISKHKNTDFDTLKNFFACSRIILFGVAPQQIGLGHITANQAEAYNDVNVLATYSLGEMSGDAKKKTEFWNVLKSF